jgi:tRNA(Ile2) C34 agmatinyltransferase TiaS
MDLPQNNSLLAKTSESVQLTQMETVVEEKIAVNGTMAYKTSQKISIANLGNAPVCPSCSNMMIFAEGCMKCEACGYSKCG